MEIVTVTLNPAIDASCEVDQVVSERKLRCSALSRAPGGGGLNVARAVARLDGRAHALWSCGGATGALLGDLLDEEAISQEPVPIADLTRENLIVYETSSGEQYRFGLPGPELSGAEVAAWRERVLGLEPTPAYLVLSGSLPPGVDDGFYADLAHSVPQGVRVVVDTSGAALQRAAEAGVFLLKPNLRELSQLVGGEELTSDEEIERAARRVVERGGAQVVLVSLGRAGGLLVTREGTQQLRTPTVSIKSKVGAGDSTVAGMVLQLQRGASVEDAARYAMAAGAAAVMTPGTGLCRRHDTESLYGRIRQLQEAPP